MVRWRQDPMLLGHTFDSRLHKTRTKRNPWGLVELVHQKLDAGMLSWWGVLAVARPKKGNRGWSGVACATHSGRGV